MSEHGFCAICDAPLPPGTRPSRPRVICDRPECRSEAARYGARVVNARRRRQTGIAQTERRCPQCGETKPLDADHFYVDRKNPDGSPALWSRWCKPCKCAHQREHHDPEKRRASKRAQRERAKAKRDADPVLAAAYRAKRALQARKLREADPEKTRARRKRYRERVKQDPERLQAARETARMALRLRRERETGTLEVRNRHEAELDEPQGREPRVPAAPLVAFIDRLAEQAADRPAWAHIEASTFDGCAGTVCESLGISLRLLHRWRTGDPDTAKLSTVDMILTRGDVLWWDVFNEETVPDRLELSRVERLMTGASLEMAA